MLGLDFNFLKCSCQPFYNQVINSNAVLYVCIYCKLCKIWDLNLKHYYWCLKVENQLCTVKNLLATSLEKSASEQQQLELELSATREQVAEVESQLLLAEQVGCNWITFNVVNIHSVKRNTETLVVTSKDTGLVGNAEKPKYIFTSHEQNVGQNIKIKDS
jgi:hypothetical protein